MSARPRRLIGAALISTTLAVVGQGAALADSNGSSSPDTTSSAALTEAAIGNEKQQSDATDPNYMAAPAPTAVEAQAAASRLARAQQHAAQAPEVIPASCPPSDPCGPTHTSWNLAATQEPQINSYCCGPASNGGTAWYDGRFPVEAAMDKYTAAKGLHDDSVGDIDDGAPLVGDAWEVVNGAHLVGHPNRELFHWFAIRGYSSSGATTAYQDSVHGAGTIGWSSSVPAYSSLPTNSVASIVGGRGYVW